MNLKVHIAVLLLGTLLIPLSQPSYAALSASYLQLPASAQLYQCARRAGPFASQGEAESVAQQARMAGYRTSGVWGEDGVVSSSSNRRYYFTVFYC